MTERFASLLILGALPLFFVGSYPTAFVFLGIYNALAVALFLFDRRQIGAPLLEVSREHDATWRLGRAEPMTLTLVSRAPGPMLVDVREDLPEGLDGGACIEEVDGSVGLDDAEDLALIALGVSTGGSPDEASGGRSRFKADGAAEGDPEDEDPDITDLAKAEETALDVPCRQVALADPPALAPLQMTIPASSAMKLKYTLTPSVQGPLRLGLLHYRLHGPLGLARVQASVDISSTVEVAAPLGEGGRLSRVTNSAAGEAGGLPSRSRGSGVELESLRQYSPGDTFRKINWKASARRGKVIVRETLDEIDQQWIVLLDASRLMGVQTVRLDDPASSSKDPDVTRLELAVEAAQLVVEAGLKQNDKVGLWVFADEVVSFVKPSRGRRHRLQISRLLQEVEARAAVGDLSEAATHMCAQVRRRSRVVLITQPPPDPGPWLEAVTQLRTRHQVLVMTLADPALRQVLETPSPTPDSALRRAAAADLSLVQDLTRERLAEEGVTVLALDPTQATAASLGPMLKAHMR